MHVTKGDVVVLDYNDLINKNCNLNSEIERAFGNDGLGACFVKNVPNLAAKRKALLTTASKLAALPQDELDATTDASSYYSFGWSHGKEIMNGKPDFAKGSYYNNPIHDVPPNLSEELHEKFPTYYAKNVWPESLPALKEEFMDLGQLIVSVGKDLAYHCDKYLSYKFSDLPKDFILSMIKDSSIHKARLLHYFPILEEETEDIDSWCGLHLDHSALTGLTSALYVDESTPEYIEVDKEREEIMDALSTSGLYIRDRKGDFTKVNIPSDYLAFQIGEAAQIASRDQLIATPHLVKGGSYPKMARNTFAVFMQPEVDFELKPNYTFAQFSKEVFEEHH